ncbi:glycosyltransferase family 8 protein [Methanobrevibacter sp.]|uniref:glycosyltransferase family 8 protein n=1 Tax=Methanobrevibacter sp. TaxID=66852 RepID=UPI0038638243
MNYKTNDSINVLFASDDNFAPYLGVAIYSFLKNNHQDFRKINIHILAKRISKENKTILEEIASPFGENNLIFIEDEGISKILGKKIQANRALSSFSRLFAASFLDETIEKVLYLDADSLILGSFKELWETNIENYYVAGVLDVGPDYVKTAVGLSKDVNYINAGVLLINLKKWRNEDVESKFIDFLEKNNMQVYNNDQGIINATLNDSILIVDPKFNLMSPFLEKDYDDVIKWNGLKNYYDKETIENAIKNPVFLHFVHFINGRPWFKDTKHPCKDLYLKYASETQYKNDVVVEDYRGLKYKLFFSLTNFLPYKLVCLIYRPYRDFFIKYF